MTDEFEALDGAVGPHRRDFLKGLVLGAAFASPLVSSFTMSGVESVIGDAAGATTLMSNSNTAGPNYTTLIRCGDFTAAGGTVTGTATLNGQPTPILRGNHAQRVVPLPQPGRQTIEMRYEPPGLRAGLWVSGVSLGVWLVGVLIAALARVRRARPGPAPELIHRTSAAARTPAAR